MTDVTIENGTSSIGEGAFSWCVNLQNVTIGSGVTNIGKYAFYTCRNLKSVYFQGNAPGVGAFSDNQEVIVYYLPGTTGWSDLFGGLTTALWRPSIQARASGFGIRTNRFNFTIAWASGMTVVVETCTNLTEGVWIPLETNTLTSGSGQFSDPAWTNYPNRYYRVSMPQ